MPEQDDVVKKILEIDDIIHTPARLAILIFLLPRGFSTFPEIQTALGLTSGNLSSHLRKLQEKGYVEISKRFVDLKPTTTIAITMKGKKAIDDYTLYLKNLLKHIEAED